MYGYAASSASATSLTPFTPPQQNTNPSGSAGQAAAVSQATGTSAGNVQSTVSSIQQAFSAVPNALQSLATAAPAAAAPAQTDPLSTLSNLISSSWTLPSGLADLRLRHTVRRGRGDRSLPFDIIGAGTGLHTDKIISGWNGEEAWPETGTRRLPASRRHLNLTRATPPTLSAGLAEANTVGALSVPPTWAVATPAVRPIAMHIADAADHRAGAVPAAAAAEIAGAGSGTMLRGDGGGGYGRSGHRRHAGRWRRRQRVPARRRAIAGLRAPRAPEVPTSLPRLTSTATSRRANRAPW